MSGAAPPSCPPVLVWVGANSDNTGNTLGLDRTNRPCQQGVEGGTAHAGVLASHARWCVVV